MQISEIISKLVISLYEPLAVGVVENVLVDKKTKKLTFLKIYSENTNEYLLLHTKNIYAMGEVITIKNTSCLHLATTLDALEDGYFNPLNAQVVNLHGQVLGKINSAEIAKDYRIQSLHLNSNALTLDAKNILSANDNIAILNTQPPKRRHTFAPRKTMPSPADYAVTIVSAPQPETRQTPPASMNATQPKRIISDYQFLLNRKITANILAKNGEVLLKKHTVITHAEIAKARINGKLLELTQKSQPL